LRVLIVTAALVLPSLGVAQDCRTIESDLDRLACYDRESGRTPVTTVVPTKSEWGVRVDESEMTDETTVVLRVESEDPVQCNFSGMERPTLILRCQENTTAVYIATDGCHMASSEYNNYGDVTYRLDNDPARTRGFQESTDNRALGLWSGGEAIPLIKAMLGHDEMLVRFTPFSSSPLTAKFPIAGLDEAVRPLREACGW
jgi:type VI secretion system protein VasI